MFCIITTYRSSNLLSEFIKDIELIVLDEAHHMAGVVAGDDESIGITRVLMKKAVDLGIKRLSLTFTPRIIHVEETESKYMSMDDTCIFGPIIAELKLRDLIEAGVLPDYRLWMLRDKALKGTGVIAKAECLLNAWRAKEIVREKEVFILHHLIVFAATLEDARNTAKFLRDCVDDSSRVFYLEGGDNVEVILREFSLAPRAILVNCFVLNEGVDIPVANAVSIIYPKQSRGQITQMVLRAGRWADGKSLFHILLPILGDEDTTGFEEVMTALASHDERIRDEIWVRSQHLLENAEIRAFDFEQEIRPEIVVWDEYEADPEKIRQGFDNVRKRVFPTNTRGQIRTLCLNRGIDTSVDYRQDLREENPNLPENPCFSGETWFDFLHPNRQWRMDPNEFVNIILVPKSLFIGSVYDEWRGVQSTDFIARLPSVQHINDGYFGPEYTDFKGLVEKFRPTQRRNR